MQWLMIEHRSGSRNWGKKKKKQASVPYYEKKNNTKISKKIVPCKKNWWMKYLKQQETGLINQTKSISAQLKKNKRINGCFGFLSLMFR